MHKSFDSIASKSKLIGTNVEKAEESPRDEFRDGGSIQRVRRPLIRSNKERANT